MKLGSSFCMDMCETGLFSAKYDGSQNAGRQWEMIEIRMRSTYRGMPRVLCNVQYHPQNGNFAKFQKFRDLGISQSMQRHNFLRNEYILNPKAALCSARQGESFDIRHVIYISFSVFSNFSEEVHSQGCNAAPIQRKRFQ